MRRTVFCLIAMACWLWLAWPGYAHADPITAAITAAVSSITLSSIAASVGTALLGTIVSAGLGMAANALAGQGRRNRPVGSEVDERSRRISQNVMGTVEPVPICYGTARVPGIRVFIEPGLNNRLNTVTLFSEGPVQGLQQLYVDGSPTTPNNPADGFFGKVLNQFFFGLQEQPLSDVHLAETEGKLTTDHQWKGFAGIYLGFEKNADLFPQIPTVTAVLNGRIVYDPRTGSDTFSNNPALCIRDYLKGRTIDGKLIWGRGLDPTTEIDDPSFIEAANYCDELVTTESGTQARYTLNGFVDTSKKVRENLDEMLTSCNAVLFHSQGKYYLRVMKAEVPLSTIDEDIIIGGITQRREGKRFQYNTVKATWLNPAKKWSADIVEYSNAEFLAEDGEPLVQELDLPFTTNAQTARELAEIACKQSRLTKKIDMLCTQAILQHLPGDVLSLTYPDFGYTAQPFRLMGTTLQPDGNIKVSLEEYDDDVYTSGPVSSEDLGVETSFKSPREVTAPGSPMVTEELYTTINGLKIKATLTWAESPDPYVSHYVVSHQAPDSSEWVDVGTTTSPRLEIFDLQTGANQFRIKALNHFNFASAWVTVTKDLRGKTSRPADITGAGINVLGKIATISWDEHVDLDVRYGGFIRIRHTEDLTGQEWGGTIPIANVAGNATSVTVPLKDGTYLLRAIDSSGNISEGIAEVLSTGIYLNSLTLLGTLELDPTFTGTRTNMIVASNTLKLDSKGDFDAIADFDALANLDGEGGIHTSGSYYSTTYLDLTTVQDVTLVLGVTATAVDGGFDFDGIPDFDAIESIDGSAIDAIDAIFYYRTTNDDPAGSPTWGPWKPLLVNEDRCRAIQAGVVVNSDFSNLNLEIPKFEVEVYS